MKKTNIDFNNSKKILFIHYGAIGDFIAGTIAIKAIRDSFPNAHITLLSKSNTREICPAGSIVDEYLILETGSIKKLWKTFWFIRKQKFDIAINLKNFSEVSHFIVLFSRAKIRAGLSKGIWNKFYTHVPSNGRIDFNQHEYLKNLSIVQTINASNLKIEAYVHISEINEKEAQNFLKNENLLNKNFLVIAPGASDFRKAWQPERFTEIIKKFLDKYNDTIILTWGSENEKKLVEGITQNIKNENLLILPRFPIGTLAAILKMSKMCLCNNSGVMHVAYAVNTTVLCLNTSISWQAFGPKGYNINAFGSNLENNKFLPIDEVKILLSTISVEQVWRVLQTIWEEETKKVVM